MNNTNTINATEQTKALTLHARLDQIQESDVKRDVVLERSCPRKELAAAARKLFKSLGLKGISVTAPNYSMAQSVDVSLPKREDYVFDQFRMVIEGDEARAANNAAHDKIALILYTAFPSHRDRSDTQSDHFDYRWSIS
jgi:hypothetical protein